MHQGSQEYQECQSPHSRVDHPSPKPLQAAHLACKVPMATTLLVPKMQRQLESPVMQKRQPE
eukprot:2210526-Prorocentrum_lima.AAC.1